MRQLLRQAGLRPTRQRMELADLIFGRGHRHVTAEGLHGEALQTGIRLSLATVYNTLNQFTAAGIVRVLAIEGARTYFDTDVSDHHHFFNAELNVLADIVDCDIQLDRFPDPPPGMEIVRTEIVVRLRKIDA